MSTRCSMDRPPPTHLEKLVKDVRKFFSYSSKYELITKIFVILVALLSLSILLLVLVEVGGMVNQRISAALQSKQDRAVQIVQDSLGAMSKFDETKPELAPVAGDQVLMHRTDLAPRYPAEKAMFPEYVKAFEERRYKVLSGETKALWSRVEDMRSAIGGIDYAVDWWDLMQSTVDIAGSIFFTGVNTDASLISPDYEAMLKTLGLSADEITAAKTSGVVKLQSKTLESLLPRSAIPRKTQLGALLYKRYSTDPQKLTSFNLRIATDDWMKGISSADLQSSSTCFLKKEPSFALFEGNWCPRTFMPSASYTDWYKDGVVGDWVIECDTPNHEARVENVRWHSGMGARYSTAFYHLDVKIQGLRKVIFSQKDLLEMAAWPTNASFPISGIVATPHEGTYEPQASNMYIVETDTLPHDIRNLLLGIAVVCVVYTRCSFIGVCTLFHYVLESPLCILVDIVYAILTYPSGTELCSILAYVDSPTSAFKKFVYMAIVLRPFTVPALLIAKSILSLRYGFLQVAYCVTIKELVALIVIQVIYISAAYKDVVAVGMHPMTTSDEMTSFVWSFVGAIIAIAVAFIILRFLLGKALDDYLKARLSSPSASVIDATDEKVDGETVPSRGSESKRHSGTLMVTAFPSYDDFLGGKFFSFGICLLPTATVGGFKCRVIEGTSIWLDVFFNFNMNGLVGYHQVLRPGFICRVSRIGQYVATDVPVDTEEQKQSGYLYIA